ncbi:MAG TPA: radical SAM protein [Solirubrobacteraceae bacterium]|nr:radical SAM protein [Solirubrobacteraceae bacterium]
MGSTTEPSPAATDVLRSGFLPDRIVHLHPTRLCNLACLHCYSESGPGRRGALPLTSVTRALGVLRAEGYEAVSLSGGEPLVYRDLGAVVRSAKELGFRVTMITNGLLVGGRTAGVLAELDGIAVSFDGLAETHDAIRGRRGAFDRACAALERLAAEGRPVAAAISLTRDAIPELPDLADHLAGLGAQALQIRPVARAGRAQAMSPSAFGSSADRARLFLVAAALGEELAPDVRVHCDLAPTRGLWRERHAYAALLATCRPRAATPPLADLVNPLVITDDGRLKPIAYDFDPRFDVAPLEGLTAETLARYKEERLAGFRDLVGAALATLEHRRDLVDWFDHCTRLSEAEPAYAEPNAAAAAT